MKNLILITFVLMSTTFAFGQNVQTLTPEMVNQQSPFVSENSLRGQAVRAFKSGSPLPNGASVEYTSQDRLVSFSKNESRSGLTDGAYILPAGSPVIRIGNVYYYPYCGNRFSTFAIMEKEVEYITQTEYIEKENCACPQQTIAYQQAQYVPQFDCTTVLQQARSLDVQYRNRQIRYKDYIAQFNQLRAANPSCFTSDALRRNNDGVKVGYFVAGAAVGYFGGKLLEEEDSYNPFYTPAPVTPVNDPNNHGGNDDDYHSGSTPRTPGNTGGNTGGGNGGYNGGSNKPQAWGFIKT